MNSVLFASGNGEWETPRWLFDALDEEFRFTLDAAATVKNALCKRFFTKEDSALTQDWGRERVYVNPPYGRGVGDWVRKASTAAANGALVVMLLPARTDTSWWWDYIQDRAEVRFLRGRLKFGHPNGSKNSAPFPSCVVVFRPRKNVMMWRLGGQHEEPILDETQAAFLIEKLKDPTIRLEAVAAELGIPLSGLTKIVTALRSRGILIPRRKAPPVDVLGKVDWKALALKNGIPVKESP